MERWPAQCGVPECTLHWAELVPLQFIDHTIVRDVLNIPTPTTYEEWAEAPEGIYLCRKHYREIKNKSGYIFGYRKNSQGHIERYVKEVLF